MRKEKENTVEKIYMGQTWKAHLSLGKTFYWLELSEVAEVHSEGVYKVWSSYISGKKGST